MCEVLAAGGGFQLPLLMSKVGVMRVGILSGGSNDEGSITSTFHVKPASTLSNKITQ